MLFEGRGDRLGSAVIGILGLGKAGMPGFVPLSPAPGAMRTGWYTEVSCQVDGHVGVSCSVRLKIRNLKRRLSLGAP